MNAAKSLLLSSTPFDLHIAGRVLIRQLQLHIQAGECWCVLGPNGSGKSTLLRTLAGFDAVGRQVVHLDGQPLSAYKPEILAQQRAYLPQEQHDVFGLTVLQQVLLARHPHAANQRWESAADLALAQQALQQLDIAHLAQRDVRTLSGGERQRVALAALFAQETPLLLLDEPTNHLDLPHQMALIKQLQNSCLQDQKTVVMSLHDINLAARVASHVLLLLPQQQWLAGAAAEVLTADNLKQCLGYPLQLIEHQGQRLWWPLDQ